MLSGVLQNCLISTLLFGAKGVYRGRGCGKPAAGPVINQTQTTWWHKLQAEKRIAGKLL